MPKTPSHKLFDLIKGLSGSEKRYFKVYAGKQAGPDSKYLRLFDAIDAQQSFDDGLLRRAVYGSSPVQSRKYSELKSYLYDWVLRSLQGYDEKTSTDYKIKHYLLSIRVLFRRSRFDACQEILAKAKKTARQYEQFTALLDLLGWEKQLAYARADIDYLDEALPRISKEERLAIEQLQTVSAYRNLFFRLLVSLRKDASLIGADYRQKLGEVVDDPLLQEASRANSHQARVYYFRTLSIYRLAISDLQGFYELSHELIRLMESQPHFLREDVSEYISALSNLIMSCGRLGRHEELEAHLLKLKQVPPLTSDDELKIHRQYYQNRFSLCIARGEFELGMKELRAHLKARERFELHFFDTPTFFYNYFYIAFGAGAYDEALTFLNQWLNLDYTVERQDLQGIARILNLIVHFELGNYVLLDSLLRSTYRYLKKRGQLHRMEQELLGLLRKAINAPSKQDILGAYSSIKDAFGRGEPAQTQSFFTKAFDIMAWLKSKIEDRTFAEVLKDQYDRARSA